MDNENQISSTEIPDVKVTKRHFPRINNSKCLEFVFEKDPNLFLRKHKIIIRGSIEVDKGYTVDNGFASKLFSMMSVEIDSQTVSKSFNRFVLFVKQTLI